MIKVLHFADLHLGVESYGRIDPSTGLSSRLLDFRQALKEVVDFALENDVDLVLFCGDAYKNRNPSQTQQREFAKEIRRLAENGVPIFLLVGNHDLPSAIGRATSVEIFDTLAIRNVFVGDKPELHRIETKHGRLQVVSLPWFRRDMALGEETRNLPLERLNEKLEEFISFELDRLIRLADPDLPTILAGHLSLSTAKLGSERGLMVGKEPMLRQSSLARPEFDYVALGHIHHPQVLSLNPPIVYSGSLQPIDFNDEGEEKGFYLVELERGRVEYRFHPVKIRRFLTISVDANGDYPTEVILQAIQREEVKDAIVRLRIKTSTTQESLIREGEIRQALKGAQAVLIQKEFERASQPRVKVERPEELTPLEWLSLYLKSKKMPPDKTKVLLEYGERLIRETGESLTQ